MNRTRIDLRMLAVWLSVAACSVGGTEDPDLSKTERQPEGCCLEPGQYVPNAAEREVSGAIDAPIRRGSLPFSQLVRVDDGDIAFKDEEGNGADRYMTRRLRARLRALAELVAQEWPQIRLRVTEAWDETQEHGRGSLHYEGRAADITTSDLDTRKLGRLAKLAVAAGLDWVYFEDGSHVHVSVRP